MLIFALLLSSAPAHAARPLTYGDALAAAAETNPALVIARLASDQAGHDVVSALGRFDPTLAVSGGWNLTQQNQVRQEFSTLFLNRSEGFDARTTLNAQAPTGTTATLSAGVSRQVFSTDFRALGDATIDPGQIFSRQTVATWIPSVRLTLGQELLRGVRTSFNLQQVRQARERQTLSELETERARQQAIADVAAAYWNWVYAARLSEISRQSVAVAEENLRVGQARVAQGRAPQVEVTRLEAALVQAQAAALDADNGAAQAADALLLLMGQPPGQDLVPATPVGDVPLLVVDPEDAVDTALAGAADVRRAREALAAAEQGLRDARHALLPSLTATVTGEYSGAIPQGVEGVTAGDLMVPSVTVGGALAVPLGNRAAVGFVRRAEAEVARRRTELSLAEAQLTSAVLQQVRVLEASARRVQLADANLRLARETLAADEALHETGRTLLQDVLRSRTEVERAEGEAMRARTDLRRAEVELLRLEGGLGVPER